MRDFKVNRLSFKGGHLNTSTLKTGLWTSNKFHDDLAISITKNLYTKLRIKQDLIN